MADAGIGDYFISDTDSDMDEDDDLLIAPVVVPLSPAPVAVPVPVAPTPQPVEIASEQPVAASPTVAMGPQPAQAPSRSVVVADESNDRVHAAARPISREDQLVQALDELMDNSPDVEASALVSLDGFTMASALPEGMQEDRVGAMSAAILGLGERAAAELGRGRLSQVFIEGADGYVLLMSAGDRAVLTVLADSGAKLGLVLYDMRQTAGQIGEILR